MNYSPEIKGTDAESVLVSKHHLQKLEKEITQLKLNLQNVLKENPASDISRHLQLETEQSLLKEELNKLQMECQHWKARYEASLGDIDKEKEERLGLKCDMEELNDQLVQQSEFCASMGAACCTLLWRVSRCEDSIQAILVGTKVDEFLIIVSRTLESFTETFSNSSLPADNSEEMQFILALCGVITNIAASDFGRDFLMTNEHGRAVVDTMISTLHEMPPQKCGKMKNLLLMCLYNVSINQKGLEYISMKPGLIALLASHLQQDSEAENQLNCLRLIQSLFCDPHSASLLLPQANAALKKETLQELAGSWSTEIKQIARELIVDLNSLNSHQSAS